ncbi:MAG: DUF5067 domain-containing protein [Clostridia bacterium]|nr:DUF5067 domain-containing protein [Clostridia bacterium]
MAKNKLTNCKVCGAEIAESAKNCPSCGAKIKKKSPVLIGAIVLVVLIGIIASMGEDDKPKKVDSNTTTKVESNTKTEKEKTEFYIGETAELKDVSVSFVEVTESNGSTYNKPTDGNVFVLCEFEIANNSNREISVSSMLSFEAYCDDYTCTYSLAALMEKGNKNQLDGTVGVGKKFKGVIGYEVSSDWKELEVRFTPDFWSGKDIVFIANR